MLDVTKRYPLPSTIESKEDIDEWNYNEFDDNKFSRREILLAEWRETQPHSEQFEFKVTHERMFQSIPYLH